MREGPGKNYWTHGGRPWDESSTYPSALEEHRLLEIKKGGDPGIRQLCEVEGCYLAVKPLDTHMRRILDSLYYLFISTACTIYLSI